MDERRAYELLQELLSCHAPAGREQEVEAILQRELARYDDALRVWQDDASNIIAHLPGPPGAPRALVLAHKDEIAMAVAEIRADGRLRVEACGGAIAWKYGEGPVDIRTDDGWLRAILSVGSSHTRSGPVAELMSARALTWADVTLFTGKTVEELAALGVRVGSRCVVARERKQLQELGQYIASYALDDRLGLVSLLWALAELVMTPPALDLYFAFSSSEEIGLLGALYAAQQLRPQVAIAIDTSPVAHGTGAALDARPIIWARELVYHDAAECETLARLAAELGFGAQSGALRRGGIGCRWHQARRPRRKDGGIWLPAR